MFYVERKVAFSETGTDYAVKLTKILDYYQDVTIRQAEELGVGVRTLRDQGMGWVLSSWQVIVNRYPTLDEKIYVGTAPYEFKGFMGYRKFCMKSESGEILSVANSLWSFVDINKMSLIRIPDFVSGAYEKDDKPDMECAPRKIKLMDNMEKLSPLQAMYHNIDINGHVNNAQYIAMAEDIIPEGRKAKQMRAEYRASAKYGNTIFPYLNVNEDSSVYTLSLADEDAAPYVIVEFTV